MIEQASFDFTAPPAPPAGEVERLLEYLYKQGRVCTSAKQIKADLGFNDRKIRLIRAAAKNKILSAPGCPGYLHFNHATFEEVQEAAARKRSQIRAMTRDYIDLRRRAHALIH